MSTKKSNQVAKASDVAVVVPTLFKDVDMQAAYEKVENQLKALGDLVSTKLPVSSINFESQTSDIANETSKEKLVKLYASISLSEKVYNDAHLEIDTFLKQSSPTYELAIKPYSLNNDSAADIKKSIAIRIFQIDQNSQFEKLNAIKAELLDLREKEDKKAALLSQINS